MANAHEVARKRHRRSVAWRWIAGGVVLVALVAFAGARADPRRFATVVEHAEPTWLLAIVALQVATYACLVHVWWRVVRRVDGHGPTRRSLVGLALAELFTDQALPSGGVGGTIFVVSALKRRGVSRAAAGAAVTVSLFGLYAAQLVAVLASLIALLVERALGTLTSTVAAVAVGAAVATPLITISIAVGGLKRMPPWLRRFSFVETLRGAVASAPRAIILDPWVVGRATGLRLMILAADGATLAAALAALGHPIGIAEACIVFSLASTAASISFLPGGLGGYEAVSIALLIASGVPIEAAAPATLLMRGFSFWLPMVPGVLFARREIAAGRKARRSAARRLLPSLE